MDPQKKEMALVGILSRPRERTPKRGFPSQITQRSFAGSLKFGKVSKNAKVVQAHTPSR
jgi:hypothetical protein